MSVKRQEGYSSLAELMLSAAVPVISPYDITIGRAPTDRYSAARFWPWLCELGPLSPGETCRENKDPTKNMSLSLSIGRQFLIVQFRASLESNLCTAMTRQNITENSVPHYWINARSQQATEIEANVFSTAIHFYWLYLTIWLPLAKPLRRSKT